ncbi:MAG: hypothetical protein Q7V53_03030 [Caldisericota bacterium]|nr:hypothetical protein [Caldisericota bacterium]
MNNDQYTAFETPFRATARPLIERLRELLTEMGHGPFNDVAVVDLDVDRGLGFEAVDDPEQYVQLMLLDGDEYGYEGVALNMTCSIVPGGQVWAPGNFTSSVGMTTVEALLERLATFEPGEAALAISSHWADRQAGRETRVEGFRFT